MAFGSAGPGSLSNRVFSLIQVIMFKQRKKHNLNAFEKKVFDFYRKNNIPFNQNDTLQYTSPEDYAKFVFEKEKYQAIDWNTLKVSSSSNDLKV